MSNDELIKGLSSPAAYTHPVASLRHLQTHISHVFLTGDYAYKVKKPVNFGFLDFSTLEKRRVACEEELRINRRLSPDLYLAVVPITGSESQPIVEGDGTPIEYAVKMREFDQAGLLDRVLQRDELNREMIDAIARRLASFHMELRGQNPPAGCGTSSSVRDPAIENFEHLERLLRDPSDCTMLAKLRMWTQRQAEQLSATFDQRRAHGFVRECHGDLHLRNIALVGRDIRIFDGIEFNESLRWTDAMSEVAFLAMDLAVRRREDLAFRFLNQYLEITGDYEGIGVLRYYLVYRAMVRAKVDAIRASQTDLNQAQRAEESVDCHEHLQWALGMIERWEPAIVVLHGFSGSGKTTYAMPLLEQLGAFRVRSDVERKRLFGVEALHHANNDVAKNLYSHSTSERTYARLAEVGEQIVHAGFPAIVDATFLRRTDRDCFRAVAKRLGIPFVIVSFQADVETLRKRVMERSATALDASDADVGVLEQQIKHHDPIADDEMKYTVRVESTLSSTQETNALSDLVRMALRQQR